MKKKSSVLLLVILASLKSLLDPFNLPGEFSSDEVHIPAVVDDMRCEDQYQFGFVIFTTAALEKKAQPGDILEKGNAGIAEILIIFNQAAQDNRLSVMDDQGGFHLSVENRIGVQGTIVFTHVTDLLAQFYLDQTAGIDVWGYLEDDAGFAVLNGIGYRAAGGGIGDLAGYRGDFFSHLDESFLVVNRQNIGRGKNVDI